MKKVKPAITIDNEDLKKKIIHPLEKEDELFNTRLPVHAPYNIFDYKGTHIIAATSFLKIEGDDTEYTIEEFKNKFDKPSFINPFSEENLLEDIANIDIIDNQSILLFCNRYGLYGQSIIEYQLPPFTTSPLNVEVKEEVPVNISESYDYFLENTYLIQLILKMVYDETPQLEKKFMETNDSKTLEELKMVRRAFTRLVNRGLRLVSPCINYGENGESLPSYTSVSLLGAAYYQLYETITEGKKFRRCLQCGSLFIPRSSIGKYCPPLKFGKHSSCENRYNQMKRRARISVREKGKKIEDVAKSIGRPVNEVRGWFN